MLFSGFSSLNVISLLFEIGLLLKIYCFGVIDNESESDRMPHLEQSSVIRILGRWDMQTMSKELWV